MNTQRRAFLASTLALAATQRAWAQGTPQGTPKKGGVLKVSAPTNPSSLDPATGGSGQDHAFLYPIFDTLVEFDFPTLKALPGLAESWKFPDTKTLVLNLRSGVQFHDGTPLDAEAVKFNLERNKNDARSSIKADLLTVDSIEVSGPMQVTLKLNQPDSALPLILSDRAGMMCSPKAVKELGKDHDRKPVGSGPYRCTGWNDNEKVTYARNDKYWKPGQPLLDGMEFAVITETNTGLRSVVAGQNDFVYFLSPQQKAVIDRAKNLTAVTGPTLYCVQIFLNYGRPPIDNPKVRLAINHAIDRTAFSKATMGGLAEPAWMDLPSAHWAYDPALANAWPHDPDKARKLLAEAGHPGGIDLPLLGYTDQRSQQRQEVLVEQFSKAGIRCKFTTGSIPEMSAAFFVDKKGDGLLAAWTGRPDPSLTYSLMFAKGSYYNAGRTEWSPELTAALLESRASEDLEARKAAFAKVQKIVVDSALVVPLLFQLELDAHAAKVKGYRPNLLGKPRFDGVWLES
jgi:peptide/nickel transport system permease protein/peptide/nickel transport system substrate-binding protein